MSLAASMFLVKGTVNSTSNTEVGTSAYVSFRGGQPTVASGRDPNRDQPATRGGVGTYQGSGIEGHRSIYGKNT